MTPFMTLALSIILGLLALWILFVIVVAIAGIITVLVEHVRMTKRRKALRKRLASQGAPFNRLERRMSVADLLRTA